jgi:hypothetical protein
MRWLARSGGCFGQAAALRSSTPHRAAQRQFEPTVDPSQVGLGLLMPDFDARMANVGRSIAEGRLRLLQAVLRADGADSSVLQDTNLAAVIRRK